jgi:transposase
MGQFGERLVQTATWYPESRVLRGSEAYTSKQCGHCGTLNDKLGGSEVFACRSEGCGAQGDRDVHAARNILLRFLE